VELGESFTDYSPGPTESTVGDDPSGAGDTGVGYGSTGMGLSDEAIASIGSDANQEPSFFGGDDISTPNIMDFGRGSVSNIRNQVDATGRRMYDPNFAALQMIGRGLTPGFDLRNQITFDVPNQMLPQLEGSRGPLGPKFYSPVERTLVEMEPVGIMSMVGRGLQSMMDSAKSSFNDAKQALGFTGDAAGGFKDEDFTGLISTRDDQQISDMSQQGATMSVTDPVVRAAPPITMTSIPQVSPMFDQFGNAYRSGFDRNMAEMAQQSLSGGIASVAPSRAAEVTQAMTDTFNTSRTRYGDLPTSIKDGDRNITNPTIAIAIGIMNREPNVDFGQAYKRAQMELAKRNFYESN